MKVAIKILNKEFYRVDKMGGSYYDTPRYQTDGSAGVDLRCTEDVTIYPGETKMISTGLAIWIGAYDNHPFHKNVSYAGLMLPRSGLGTKGLILANIIGLIDEDYQGELKISAWNRNEICEYDDNEHRWNDPIELKAGDRVAQLVFVPVLKAQWEVVEEFSNETERGKGGFNSTGRG